MIARSKKDIDERNARIVAHAKAGRTMTEILDIEGLDASNKMAFHRILAAAGVKSATGRRSAPPVGLTPEMTQWMAHIRFLLEDMSKEKTLIEVSRLLGMTNAEVTAAIQHKHNWTIAQLSRLGLATGRTFEEVIAYPGTQRMIGFSK